VIFRALGDAGNTTNNQSLGTGEQNYLEQRRPVVAEAFQKMMSANGLTQPPRTPVISFALSGGGYRAMTWVIYRFNIAYADMAGSVWEQ
jgi:hypothetical protein